MKLVVPAATVAIDLKLLPSVERSMANPDSLSDSGCQARITSAWDLYEATWATVRLAGAPRDVGLTWVTCTWSKCEVFSEPLLWAVRARPTKTLADMSTSAVGPSWCQ